MNEKCKSGKTALLILGGFIVIGGLGFLAYKGGLLSGIIPLAAGAGASILGILTGNRERASSGSSNNRDTRVRLEGIDRQLEELGGRLDSMGDRLKRNEERTERNLARSSEIATGLADSIRQGTYTIRDINGIILSQRGVDNSTDLSDLGD